MASLSLCEEIDVPRAVADCYRYLLDFSTIEQWDPSVRSARKRTPGPVRPGTQFELQLQSFGRRFAMDYRLAEAEPPQRLRLSGAGGGVRADDELHFIALGAARTRIRYEATLAFDDLGALGVAALRRPLQRMGRATVEGLRRALVEASPSPPRPRSPSLRERLILPAALDFTARGYRRMAHKGHSRFMDGQTVVITGPTAGIGLAAACELARLGARLVLVGRGRERLERAVEQIHDFAGAPSAIRLIEADLLDAGAIARAAERILACEPRVDVLINNAGALFAERALTADGHERSYAINLLAPYRLTTALMPLLAQSGGRVINVSSGGQYLQPLQLDALAATDGDFDGVKAYARAKRGLVALTRSWAQQVPQVAFHAMHPGWVATPGVARSLPVFHRVMQRGLRDPRMGADTIVWLASAPAEGLGSGHFWLDRRIVPVDVLPGTAVGEHELQRLAETLAAA